MTLSNLFLPLILYIQRLGRSICLDLGKRIEMHLLQLSFLVKVVNLKLRIKELRFDLNEIQDRKQKNQN